MSRYVIDAVTLLRVTDDPREIAGHQLVAPNAIRSQALDLLLDQVRAGQLDERAALQQHERLTTQKIRLLGDRVSRRKAWDLAHEQDWPTIRHAEYLSIARLQADALITVDPELAALAAHLVPTAEFDDLFR